MGCYLSTPDNRVYVEEGKGKDFVYATASCQGWRKEQEDAEECIPYYDENASLFVLCDGHGGAEVAKYTVEHLPEFIKNHPLYKEGNYEKALQEAFIDFDEHLKSKEVMEELNRIAHDGDEQQKEENDQKTRQVMDLEGKSSSNQPESGGSSSSAGTSSAGPSTSAGSSSNNGPKTVVEDVDSETLRREARMPLLDLIAGYTEGMGPAGRRSLLPHYNASPVVKSRKEDDGDSVEEAADKSGPSSSKADEEPSLATTKSEMVRHLLEKYFPDEDSSDDSSYEGEESSDDEDGDDECDYDAGEGSGSKKLRKKKQKRNKARRVESSSNDESDADLMRVKANKKKASEEEEDAESGASERSRSSSDGEEDADDSDDDEDVADDEDNDEDEDDDDDDDDEDVEGEDEENDDGDDPFVLGLQNYVRPAQKTHVPGKDSGCTVVVALVKDNKIYVASAGDSRCILILRNGECKPMSFDHKPEDTIERSRINKAGGRIFDGRVNGGLNLSRAFGDFCYKSRSDLGPKEQMITALPDVKTAQLDPKEVEYIFLACDGIWNSMKNKEVAKFIRNTAPTVKSNLIEICLQLFRKCIAPGTDGDGTGCDNMTCIIARYTDPTLKQDPENSDLNSEDVKESENSKASSNKRTTNDDSSATSSKRKCLRL